MKKNPEYGPSDNLVYNLHQILRRHKIDKDKLPLLLTLSDADGMVVETRLLIDMFGKGALQVFAKLTSILVPGAGRCYQLAAASGEVGTLTTSHLIFKT